VGPASFWHSCLFIVRNKLQLYDVIILWYNSKDFLYFVICRIIINVKQVKYIRLFYCKGSNLYYHYHRKRIKLACKKIRSVVGILRTAKLQPSVLQTSQKLIVQWEFLAASSSNAHVDDPLVLKHIRISTRTPLSKT
jgi:hypothetical protein